MDSPTKQEIEISKIEISESINPQTSALLTNLQQLREPDVCG